MERNNFWKKLIKYFINEVNKLRKVNKVQKHFAYLEFGKKDKLDDFYKKFINFVPIDAKIFVRPGVVLKKPMTIENRFA